jgi:hypothetical protein
MMVKNCRAFTTHFASRRFLSRRDFEFSFCGEGECECTSESGFGQFSIFGAVEENCGWGLR